MAKPTYVEIKKDDQTAKVLETAVPVWTRHGWTVVEDGSSEEKKERPAPTPPVTPVPPVVAAPDKTKE